MITVPFWEGVAIALREAGCKFIAGVPSDQPGLLDAASEYPDLSCLATRDQRVAACSAVAHATITGNISVVALSSGPSFTNALVGLLEGASLNAPVIVLSTSVSSKRAGRGAFQEIDQLAMIRPLAKWTYRLADDDRLAWAIEQACEASLNDCPGLAFIEVAEELTRVAVTQPAVARARRCEFVPIEQDLRVAGKLLNEARRPVIIAGGGAKHSNARSQIVELASNLDAAIYTTSSGRGVIDETHELALGLIGLYLTPPADEVLEEADVILAIGTRFEETALMGWQNSNAKCIKVDSARTFKPEWPTTLSLLRGDASVTVNALSLLCQRRPRPGWRKRIIQAKEDVLERYGTCTFERSRTCFALNLLNRTFERDTAYVFENGLHDMWAYHYPVITVIDGSVTAPGEQTMMGFGICSAIGAAIANPGRNTVVVCGDGALNIGLSVLPRAIEQSCRMTILVLDDMGHGWPRLERQALGIRDDLTRFRVSFPVVAAVREMGGFAAEATTEEQLVLAIREAHKTNLQGRLALIQLRIRDDDVPIGIVKYFGSHTPM